VNLANNHFAFQDIIDVSLCENHLRLKGLQQLCVRLFNKGDGFYWLTLYFSVDSMPLFRFFGVASIRGKAGPILGKKCTHPWLSRECENRPIWVSRVFADEVFVFYALHFKDFFVFSVVQVHAVLMSHNRLLIIHT